MVDVVLSYCHNTLNDTTLADLLPYFKDKGVGVISASCTSMGMFTKQVESARSCAKLSPAWMRHGTCSSLSAWPLIPGMTVWLVVRWELLLERQLQRLLQCCHPGAQRMTSRATRWRRVCARAAGQVGNVRLPLCRAHWTGTRRPSRCWKPPSRRVRPPRRMASTSARSHSRSPPACQGWLCT